MKLYLVRHGLTPWSQEKNKRYIGWQNPGLSTAGSKQAQRLAERFFSEKPFLFYASDLQRTQATAQPLSLDCGIPIELSSELRELKFGEWEGKTADELRADPRYQSLFREWFRDPFRHAPPEGESLEQMEQRLLSFLDNKIIPCQGSNQKFVLVTHGGTIRLLIYMLLGWERKGFWEFQIDHASVSILESKNKKGFQALLLNDTSHLL